MGFWDTVGTIAGGVGGFIVGGPLGAAAGATLASGNGPDISGLNVGGNGDSPGLLGTGQESIHTYTPQQGSYQDPNADASRAQLAAQLHAAQNAQAPTANAAQIGQMRDISGAQMGNASLAGNTRIGNAAQMQGAQMGNAMMGNSSAMNAAQSGYAQGQAFTGQAYQGQASASNAANINRSDLQFRNDQNSLASQLQAQASGNGPSLAENQLKTATDRNVEQQMAAAASQRGNTNSALVQRNLANQSASLNQTAGRDAANVRMQEQMNAQNQLGNVLTGARGQDIGVNQSQASLAQQTALQNSQQAQSASFQNAANQQSASLANANNQQSASLANSANRQQSMINNANLSQSANSLNAQQAQAMTLANMGAYNTNAYQQAGLNQAANQDNMSALNANALAQAQLYQQNNQFNAGALNTNAYQQAGFNQNANLANQQYQNAATMQQAADYQTTNLANQQAQLAQNGINNNAAQYYTGAGLGLNALQTQNNIQYQQDMLKQSLGQSALQQAAYESARGANSSVIGGILGNVLGAGAGAAVSGIAGSDENMKTNVRDGASDVRQFLGDGGADQKLDADYIKNMEFVNAIMAKNNTGTGTAKAGGLSGGISSGFGMVSKAMAKKPDAKGTDKISGNGKEFTDFEQKYQPTKPGGTDKISGNGKEFTDFEQKYQPTKADGSMGKAGAVAPQPGDIFSTPVPRAYVAPTQNDVGYNVFNPVQGPSMFSQANALPQGLEGGGMDMGMDVSDENQKTDLGGGAEATQNFLKSQAGNGSSNMSSAAAIPQQSAGNPNQPQSATTGQFRPTTNSTGGPIDYGNAYQANSNLGNQNSGRGANQGANFGSMFNGGTPNLGRSQTMQDYQNQQQSFGSFFGGQNSQQYAPQQSYQPQQMQAQRPYANVQQYAPPQYQPQPTQYRDGGFANSGGYGGGGIYGGGGGFAGGVSNGGYGANAGSYNQVSGGNAGGYVGNSWAPSAAANPAQLAAQNLSNASRQQSGIGDWFFGNQTPNEQSYVNQGAPLGVDPRSNSVQTVGNQYSNNTPISVPQYQKQQASQPLGGFGARPGANYVYLNDSSVSDIRSKLFGGGGPGAGGLLKGLLGGRESGGGSQYDDISNNELQADYSTMYSPHTSGVQKQTANNDALGMSGAMSQGGFSMSDEKSKNVEDDHDKEKLASFLQPLGAHKYTYKNPDLPGAGHGTYVSPMAQELQKSELGRTMVEKDPMTGYLKVNYGKGLGAMLSSEAMHEKRLSRLEKKVGK